jgi:spermidine synthase
VHFRDEENLNFVGDFCSRSLSCTIAHVKPLQLIDQTVSPDGTLLKLARRENEFLILADGITLMSSRTHGSEEALAKLACHRALMLSRPTALIGGLGMGFTLRATLDLLPSDAKVVVAELLPAIVAWNRGPLADLAREPLKDVRVRLVIDDVAAVLRSSHNEFDTILLDVDNGPSAFTASSNAGLYDDRGIASAYSALKKSGVLAVWSAQEDRRFAQRLSKANFVVETKHIRARLKKGGRRHTIFLAHKSSNA